MTDEEILKCNWKHTPFVTKYIHPVTRAPMPGWPDEWTVGCISGGTLRTEPRITWIHCPYCGKEINWQTDPTDKSLPQNIPKSV